MSKPVAWMKEKDGIVYNHKPDDVFQYIPLYKHPVKQLSDEELFIKAKKCADYWMNHYDKNSKADMAILYLHIAGMFKSIIKEITE